MTPDRLIAAIAVYGAGVVLIAYLTNYLANRVPVCPRCGRRGWALEAVPSCVCRDGRPRLRKAVCLILAEGWR